MDYRRIRKSLKKTQMEMANYCHVKQSYLCAVEKGHRRGLEMKIRYLRAALTNELITKEQYYTEIDKLFDEVLLEK